MWGILVIGLNGITAGDVFGDTTIYLSYFLFFRKKLKTNKIMWCKCPICNGTGKYNNPLTMNTQDNCRTCNGKGIISELTGFPPKYINEDNSFVEKTCAHKRIEEIQGGQIEMCKDCGKTWGR